MNYKKGFSLTELVITMGVIALLAGIAIPQYRGYRAKARRSEALTIASKILRTAEIFYGKTDKAPCSIGSEMNPAPAQREVLTGNCNVVNELQMIFPVKKILLNDNSKLYYAYQVGPGTGGGSGTSTYYPRSPKTTANKYGEDWQGYSPPTFSGAPGNICSGIKIVVRATGRISKGATAVVDELYFLSNGEVFLAKDNISDINPAPPEPIK